MAKRGFIKTIQNNSPLKNLSTTFISLALLFILSIILYFVVNKFTVEGFTGDKKIEATFITSNANSNHKFTDSMWNKIKSEYIQSNVTFKKADKQDTDKYITERILESDYPMVVFNDISGINQTYISVIKNNQLTYNSVKSELDRLLPTNKNNKKQ